MLFVWIVSQGIAGAIVAAITNVKLHELELLSSSQMTLLMFIAGIGQLIAVAIGMGYLWLRYRDARVIGWYPKFIRADWKLALAAFLIVTPILLVAQLLLSMLVEYKHPALEAMVADANVFTVLAVWIAAVISAPIAEEVIFRGWIQNWLQRSMARSEDLVRTIFGGRSAQSNYEQDAAIETVETVLELEANDDEPPASIATKAPTVDPNPYAPTHQMPSMGLSKDSSTRAADWIAIVITSLFFAMMHLGQGLAPIPLFGLSILLGYLYQRTGSLMPCIGLHMLNNGYSVFWLTMQILFGDPSAELP